MENTVGPGNKRQVWIDIAKFVGIAMVVYGHLNRSHLAHDVFVWLYSFHIPLFFMLTGLTINTKQPFRIFFKKKLHILSLYAQMYVLGYCIRALQTGNLSFVYFRGALYGNLRSVTPLSIWFLPILFLSVLAYYWIDRIPRWYLKAVVVAALFGASYLLGNRYALPWTLNLLGISVFFICLGDWLKRPMAGIRPVQAACLVLPLATISFLLAWYNWPARNSAVRSVSLADGIYGNLFLFLGASVAGSCFVLLLSKLLALLPQKLQMAMAYIGQNSVYIMVVHFCFLYLPNLLFGDFAHWRLFQAGRWTVLLTNAVGTGVILLWSLVVGLVWQHLYAAVKNKIISL